jgi:endonuclease/exonuclease/phosphatase family metal-dependent hydrolase
MKRFLKFIVTIISVLLFFAVIFFFWASSPTLSEKEYTTHTTNNYKQTKNTDSIYSIVTYNIGYLSGMTNNTVAEKPKVLFDENLKKVSEEFKLLNADIIAFQEIDYAAARSYHINQQDEIAKLGYNHVAQAVNWDETYVPFPYWPPSIHFGKTLSGQSILSKYPLKEHQRIVLERVAGAPFYRDALYLDRLAQVSTVTIENKEVILINVHLEAFDKPTRVKQLDAVIALFNTYRKKHPTILLGDFNSGPTFKNPAIDKLVTLEGTGNAAFDVANISNTYDTDKPFKRIDYIFYTKNSIEYIDGKVLTQFGQASDHLPVEMRFKLK